MTSALKEPFRFQRAARLGCRALMGGPQISQLGDSESRPSLVITMLEMQASRGRVAGTKSAITSLAPSNPPTLSKSRKSRSFAKLTHLTEAWIYLCRRWSSAAKSSSKTPEQSLSPGPRGITVSCSRCLERSHRGADGM